jgi:hypothetical protein
MRLVEGLAKVAKNHGKSAFIMRHELVRNILASRAQDEAKI